MELGKRLKEERQRLGLTQQAMAEACDASKRAQLNYEAGDQVPGGLYLAAAAGLGVDVVFVLTGNRPSQDGPPSSTDEVALLAKLRRMSPRTRKLVFELLDQLELPKERTGITIKGGEQGQVIQGNPSQKNLTINVGRPKKQR